MCLWIHFDWLFRSLIIYLVDILDKLDSVRFFYYIKLTCFFDIEFIRLCVNLLLL